MRTDGDNFLRPHLSGVERREGELSTILIYSNTDYKGQDKDKEVDYMSDLTTKVSKFNGISGSKSIESGLKGNRIASLNLDGENEYYGIFNNFSVLSYNESSDEIIKVHMNFSRYWNAFFFGTQPKNYTMSGVFLDSIDYPYYQEFMVAYDKYLKGTRCIENRMRTIIVYDGKIIDAFIAGVSIQANSETEMLKNFNFNLLVKDEDWARVNIASVASGNNVGSEREIVKGMNVLSNTGRVGRQFGVENV